MFELFGYDAITGRKDYTEAITPTELGYRKIESQLRSLVNNGFIPNPDDEEIKRLAMEKGKTVEDFLKYDLGIF